MGTEPAVREAIQAVVAQLRQVMPESLLGLARRTVEYVCGPLLDHGGRFPWWGLVVALIITAGAFWFDRTRDSGGFLQFCLPREIYHEKSTWIDLKIGFFNMSCSAAARSI